MKKNILITGGLGYVGGRLAQNLSGLYKVLISTRSEITPSIRSVFNDDVSFISHSALLAMDSFPDGIETVIHLTALNEIDSVKYPSDAIRVNIDHTREILEIAIKKNVKRFIYFSTIHVYGKNLVGRVDEQTLPRPTHPYAITHRAAEDYIVAAHDSRKIEGIVVRLSNSFGMPALPTVNRWSLLVNDICRQAVTTGTIQLHSNGCQYRDFITLTDVENAVKLLLKVDGVGSENVFNLSSERSITVLEMANLVAETCYETLGVRVPVRVPENSVPTNEPHVSILPGNLIRLGFQPQNNFKQELTDLIRFCQQNFKGK
jgi:UDP-glucose 4-epimerase